MDFARFIIALLASIEDLARRDFLKFSIADCEIICELQPDVMGRDLVPRQAL